jgi:Arc/MetJ family transcription regulator
MPKVQSQYPFPRIRSVDRSLVAGTNLDEGLVALATRTTDLTSKRQLSVLLVEHLLHRRARQKKGESHLASRRLALSDKVIATMAVQMLRCCLDAEGSLPAELVRLFAVLHNLEVPANDHSHAEWKKSAAASFMGFHPDASLREVARLVGVAPNTLRTWTKDPGFIDSVQTIRYFAERGLARPIWFPNETLNRSPRKR